MVDHEREDSRRRADRVTLMTVAGFGGLLLGLLGPVLLFGSRLTTQEVKMDAVSLSIVELKNETGKLREEVQRIALTLEARSRQP